MLTPPYPYQRGGQAGRSNVTGIAAGAVSTTIVAAAANTTGIIVRTCCLTPASSDGLELRDGLGNVFLSTTGQSVNYMGPGILIAPGTDVIIDKSGVGTSSLFRISWDVV
jgi:hypothetical protein